jgi:DNA repair exonuclease SbcCD ATPase subunit
MTHKQAIADAKELKQALAGVDNVLEDITTKLDTFCTLAKACREEAEELQAVDMDFLESEIETLNRFASVAKAAREDREAIEEENAEIATGDAHA